MVNTNLSLELEICDYSSIFWFKNALHNCVTAHR